MLFFNSLSTFFGSGLIILLLNTQVQQKFHQRCRLVIFEENKKLCQWVSQWTLLFITITTHGSILFKETMENSIKNLLLKRFYLSEHQEIKFRLNLQMRRRTWKEIFETKKIRPMSTLSAFDIVIFFSTKLYKVIRMTASRKCLWFSPHFYIVLENVPQFKIN